ncbi:MAG: hypothetical protein CM1200mP2_37650 [Planctomycetaceae bacterium]|nr:MAG: hypothetical protein CM1200mP2_37650 [Planctomycetaceae bacterium]
MSCQSDKSPSRQQLAGHPIGTTVQPLLIDGRQFRERAGPSQQALVRTPHPITDRETVNTIAACLDYTRQVTPDRVRIIQLDGHQATADIGVDRIDRHRLGSHQHLARPRFGIGQVPVLDHIGITGPGDVGGFHDGSSMSRPASHRGVR